MLKKLLLACYSVKIIKFYRVKIRTYHVTLGKTAKNWTSHVSYMIVLRKTTGHFVKVRPKTRRKRQRFFKNMDPSNFSRKPQK